MAVLTGGRTACIVKGAALQGSVLTSGRSHISMTVFTGDTPGVNTGNNISCAVAISTLRSTGGCKVSMAAAGGMGTFKVSYITGMTGDTGAQRNTDTMALSSTILSCSANTVEARTIAEAAIRATSNLRVNMAVLTVKVCCTGCIVDISYYIQTSIMTCRRTGRRSIHIIIMPEVSARSVMSRKVGSVCKMALQAGDIIAVDGVSCGITHNC